MTHGLLDLSNSMDSIDEGMLDDITRQKLMNSKRLITMSDEMSKYKNDSSIQQLLEDINTLV
jgi:cell fate (sporulation/competence/biofilm development) regulator YlbF (YheA/YmcA/DUF963 family)